MQIKPTLEFKHSEMKEALGAFAKLHPKLVGIEPSSMVGFKNQASLSIRVLLGFFKRGKESASTWDVAARNYKGTEKLDPVKALIQKVVLVPKKEKKNKSKTKAASWTTLQAQAPALGMWKELI